VPLRELRVGDVITYAIPIGDRHVETHRIIRIVRGGESPTVVTKGDANSVPDPWEATLHGTTGWRFARRLPCAGYGIVLLRTPTVRYLLVMVVPVMLALLSLRSIWRLRSPFPRRLRDATVR
jgi:signal peptidase